MDLGTLTRDGYLRLLKKLGGTGLTSEESTVRHAELDAIARIAEMVSEALQGSFRNLFLVSALEALDKLERVRFLLQQSTLTPERRRARLIAFGQSAKLVRDRLEHAVATYLEASTGTSIGVEATYLFEQGASPLGAFMLALREPDALEKQQRRDLAPIPQRGLPARAIAGGISITDAEWGNALDPAGISADPDSILTIQSKSRSAVIEALPGDTLTAAQWIEIQAMLCWKSHGFSINQDSQGRTVFTGELTIPPSTTLAFDGPTTNGSINWQNRFIQAWGIVDTASGADPTQLGGLEHVWLTTSKTGPASGGYFQTLFTTETSSAATAVGLQVSATGDLEISNTGLSGTKYVTLMIRCSPPYVPSSTTDTQPWIDATQMESDDVEDLYQAQVISGGVVGEFAGAFSGALRRVVYSGPLYYQGGGIPQGVVLDTSEDWRNRWVLVTGISNRNGFGADPTDYPLPATQGMLAQPSLTQPSAPSAPRLFFTGIGSAMGSPTQLANQQPMQTALTVSSLPNIWLFVRDTDGALVCEMKDGLSDFYGASMLATVVASETADGFATVTPVPVHATKVHTIDIEQPQNCGVFAQGRQGNVPRYLITDDAPRAIPTAPPMGVISEGAFPVRPVSWMVRERLGARDDARYEVRQKITGQRKRLFSAVIPAGTSVPVDDFNVPSEIFPPGINDQMDFRDRLVWVEGRYSATDITVGDASPSDDSAATHFLSIMYTGPATIEFGASGNGLYRTFITANVFVDFHFSRAAAGRGFHSRLLITNSTGAAVYVNCAIECTGFLGFADRRAVGQDV